MALFTLREFDQPHGLKYSREFLLQCRITNVAALEPGIVIPPAIRKYFGENANSTRNKTVRLRKLGRRGGVRQRLRRQQLRRIPLPSIILPNVQSLRNKIDELQASAKFLSEYRHYCIISLTET